MLLVEKFTKLIYDVSSDSRIEVEVVEPLCLLLHCLPASSSIILSQKQ